jgi:hypothetical protein
MPATGCSLPLEGIINIRNEKWKNDFSPIDATGVCDVSRTHTKAYSRHLMHSGEMLGAINSSVNNLSFYLSAGRRGEGIYPSRRFHCMEKGNTRTCNDTYVNTGTK